MIWSTVSKTVAVTLLVFTWVTGAAFAQTTRQGIGVGLEQPLTSQDARSAEGLLRLGDLYSDQDNPDKDLGKAAAYYQQAAEAGNPAAKLRIAAMTVLGQGTEQNIPAGLATIERLAASGDSDALVLLGDFYGRASFGVVTADFPRALDYYRRAAALDNPAAILRAGEMLARGQGVSRNIEEGRAMVRELADRGNQFALILLGDLLSSGDGGPVNAEEATRAYEKAGSRGRSDAFLRLGELYSYERAVAADYAKALQYYQKAAETGKTLGQLRVAELTLRGQGAPQDVEAGLAAIIELAESDNGDALLVLGDLYRRPPNGTVEKDLPKALDYYRRAAAAGNSTGTLREGDMVARGEGTKRDVAQGLTITQKLADAGNISAMIQLGDLLRDPRLAAIDGAAALAAYEQAARLGASDAFIRLGDYYYDGVSQPADLPKALDYYREAIEMGNFVGLIRAGAMIARGEGTEQDVERGRSMVREASATSQTEALIVLGDLLSRGDAGPPDAETAIRTYERAAELGRSQAYLRLGDLYRDGKVASNDGRRVVQYYRQAAELGDLYGLYSLGAALTQGLVRNAGKPVDGTAMLRKAQASGLPDAVLLLADNHLYGLGVRRQPKEAISMLEAAMEDGNIDAARQLISYYRDGRQMRRSTVIKRDPEKAEALFASISGKLSYSDRLYEELLFKAVSTNNSVRDELYDRLDELPPTTRQLLVRALRTQSPNAFVYVVQKRLKELRLYPGRVTGILNGPTTRAIYKYCGLRSMKKACRFGSMSSQAADIVSYAF